MISSKKADDPFVVAVEATRMPMIFIDAKSDQHNIVYANSSFLKMMGAKTSQIIGKPFLSTISGVQSGPPINLTDCEDPANRPIHYVDAVRSNGNIFSAALLIAPVTDSSGQVSQFFLSYVDLSQHDSIGQAEQDRLREVYRNTPGFICTTTGSDHCITFANLAYRDLVGPRDLIGLAAAEAFPELRDQGFFELLDRVYETKQPFSGRRVPIELQRRPGSPPERRVIDFIYQPVVDADGAVTGLFCEGSDVTDAEQKEQEFRLLQAQLVELGRLNAMGTMAATLAHELNQPLAAISNYAAGCIALMNEDKLTSGKVREGIESIALASMRAGQIIRRLRDMTNRAPPNVASFNLAEAVADSIHLVNAGSPCVTKLAPRSPTTGYACADRIQVQQVLINLLKNACESVANKRGARVIASISRENGEFKVSIADNGPGISIEKRKTLFDWTESDKSEGMGLGLSISRTIIDRQGGKIWLESTSEQGSEFAFTLPAARKAVNTDHG